MLKRIPFLLLMCLSFEGFAQINMVVKPGGFLFMEGSDSIFFYQKSPKDQGGKLSRCNYIHPLYGSDGTRFIRKSASMQNAAFHGRKPVAIPFRESLILKYSLLVYQGEMSPTQIQKVVK